MSMRRRHLPHCRDLSKLGAARLARDIVGSARTHVAIALSLGKARVFMRQRPVLRHKAPDYQGHHSNRVALLPTSQDL